MLILKLNYLKAFDLGKKTVLKVFFYDTVDVLFNKQYALPFKDDS